MCFNWFKKKPPVHHNKLALLFAINDYPGEANDLNGCINDQIDLEDKLKQFEGFTVKTFKNSEVTAKVFIKEVTEAISLLVPGDVLLVHYSGHGTQVKDLHGDESDGYDEALYLYNGIVIDDDIGDSLRNIPDGATVVLMFDSCFAGTVTRGINPVKNRFAKVEKIKRGTKKRHRFAPEEMKWIVFAACGEQQTSADAWFSGRPNGAFSFYALRTLQPGITYNDWIKRIKIYLPSNNFDQIPSMEGNESLFDRPVFT